MTGFWPVRFAAVATLVLAAPSASAATAVTVRCKVVSRIHCTASVQVVRADNGAQLVVALPGTFVSASVSLSPSNSGVRLLRPHGTAGGRKWVATMRVPAKVPAHTTARLIFTVK
jgi:hypothetical protein